MDNDIKQLQDTISELRDRIQELENERVFWNVQWHNLAKQFKDFARSHITEYDFSHESHDQSGMLYDNRGGK